MALLSKEDKVFVAGHKGLVGSAIVRRLQSFGYTNIIVKPREELDLLSADAVQSFFVNECPDVVFLAAAKVGGIYANNTYRADFIYENLQIQNNVIWNAYKSGVHRLVFLGSSCIYPRDCSQPIKEEYLLSGKLEYTNQPYAIAKISGIELINGLRNQYGCDYFCVMPTNLFGPNDNYHPKNSHVLPALIRKIFEAKQQNLDEIVVWGDGTPLREFMYSDDLADAVLFLSQNVSSDKLSESSIGKNNFCHINVGSNFEISIKDLAEKISHIMGFNGKIKFDHSMPNGTHRKIMDSSVLKELGWESTYDFERALQQTIVNFLNK